MKTLVAALGFLAAPMLASPAALAQSAPFCVRSVSGMTNCVYYTMAQCEQAKGVNMAAQCIPRSQASSGLPAGTTGQGGTGQVSPPGRPASSR